MSLLLFIIIFSLIIINPAYSYIDPGTGSMLFSIIIGAVSILFFAVKTAWIKIRTLPIWYSKTDAMNDKNKKDFVIYSEGKQYWNVFKPIVEEFSRRGILCYFYTSDEQDPCFEYKSEFFKPQFIGKGNKAYAYLNMMEAEVCLMTTPGLDVYQLKRSKFVKHYSHILHACDDATFYRMFGMDYFDSVLLTGSHQVTSIRTLEGLRNINKKELVIVGCTYLDELKKSLDALGNIAKSDTPTVLVSPSWGANGILRKFGMKLLKPLAESGYNIIVRPHPQSSIVEKDTLTKLTEDLKSYSNIEWDYARENVKSMAKSDIMISDFSGIIFDYLFLLGKPVLYTSYNFDKRAYDCSDIEGMPVHLQTLEQVGIKLDESDFNNIKDIVANNINNTSLSEKIKEASNTAYCFKGEAGKRAVDALLDIKEHLQ